MNIAVSLNRNFIAFAIPLSLLGILILLLKTQLLQGNDVLSFAITADLLVTVPVVYFLLIRKTTIPKTTIVPVVLIGLLIGSYLLPQDNQTYLSMFKVWVLPALELSVIAYVVIKVRAVITKYKREKDTSTDFFDTLKTVCREILPKAAVMPVVTEMAVFYYGFIDWKRREWKENEFSYHRESGSVALLVAILFIIVIETFVIHIVLTLWSDTAAWIVTGLSIYSAFQIFGFLRSMMKRPITIGQDKLHLRYGIMRESTIDLKDIISVEISSKEIEFNRETRKLSFLGDLESHNVVIRLKNENDLVGLYGIKRKYKTIAFHVDDKFEFENGLKILKP